MTVSTLVEASGDAVTAPPGRPAVEAGPGVDDEVFRAGARRWLAANVVGDYAELAGRGGPGDEDVGFDVRVEWERELGNAGWIGLGWPTGHGGRGATLSQQIIWAE